MYASNVQHINVHALSPTWRHERQNHYTNTITKLIANINIINVEFRNGLEKSGEIIKKRNHDENTSGIVAKQNEKKNKK